jgi:hypothetical protein
MNTLEKKKDELEKLHEEVEVLEREEFEREEMPKRREWVGRYLKYRNSYGAGNDEKWWLYVHITGVTDRGDFEANRLQIDCEGRLDIQRTKFEMYSHLDGGGYHDSSKEEWDAAVDEAKKMLDEISA